MMMAIAFVISTGLTALALKAYIALRRELCLPSDFEAKVEDWKRRNAGAYKVRK